MSDTVHFDKQGNYTIGGDISKMNVTAGKPSGNSSSIRVFGGAPTPAQNSSQVRRSFNLDAIKAKAGGSKPAVHSDVTPVSIPKDYTPARSSEESVNSTPAVAMNETPTAVEESVPALVEQAQTPLEATNNVQEPAPVEAPASLNSEIKSMNFSLNGLEAPAVAEEVAEAMEAESLLKEEIPAQDAESNGESTVQPVETNTIDEPETEKVTEMVQDTPETEIEEVNTMTDMTEIETMKLTNSTENTTAERVEAAPEKFTAEAGAEEPFEVISLKDMIAGIGTTMPAFDTWLRKIIAGFKLYPASVLECEGIDGLKAYSLLVSPGKKGGREVAIGYGKRITLVSLSASNVISDAAGLITVEGSCAICRDMPVASCSQRAQQAVKL